MAARVFKIALLAALAYGAMGLLVPAVGVAADRGAGSQGLLAYRILHAPQGGVVRARDGAELYVPRNTLTTDALVTISRFRGNRYDFNISTGWSGRVRVTLPRINDATFIMHRIDGI